jgi:hypothetical protein
VVYRTNGAADETWVSAALVVWTEVEPGCYLICACLLVLRPLVEQLADSSLIQSLRGSSIFSSTRGGSSRSRGTGKQLSDNSSGSHLQLQSTRSVVTVGNRPMNVTATASVGSTLYEEDRDQHCDGSSPKFSNDIDRNIFVKKDFSQEATDIERTAGLHRQR